MNNHTYIAAKLPPDEAERLAELHRYDILDTLPEIVFDRLTSITAKRFGMPIALVSLIDETRQWFKSRVGLDAVQTPRELAFCAHAILSDEVMVIANATKDTRFANNPLVIGAPDIRFYAGAPLIAPSGHRLGTLCVIDRVPHPEFNADHQHELAELAAIAVDEMELRITIKRARDDLAALQQAQHDLQQTRERAERATQEKSQFIANISHELRTPMNGILGMAYLLNDTALDVVQREYIDTINHSAQNLLLLLNDVLDLSKIEAGELLLEKNAFDMRTHFTQTIKLLKPLADKKNNQLITHIDAQLPARVISDPGRFAQVITNLVGNAVKFTDHGTISATLSYDAYNSTILCEIVDTGIGIPSNKHDAIFEKFVQGNAAITQKYGGTGLGLTITKQLVVMLGGEIGFSSEENVGSRFWFSLPVAVAADAEEAASLTQMATANVGKIDAAQAHLLIAEDHPVNQLFLTKVLKKFGFRTIDVVEHGVAVLASIRARAEKKLPAYDAIFMDCMMPEMDGYETTRNIREMQTPDSPHVPIVAMTANALSGDRETCFAAGMDAYLSKPLQPERLKELLQQWFAFELSPSIAVAAADTTAENYPPMDLSRLAMVADTMQEKAEIIALFFRVAEDYVLVLERSRRDSEQLAWKNAAHSLKGTAANLGMRRLEQLCREAEQSAPQDYRARTELLQKIRAKLVRIQQYLAEQNPELLAGLQHA